MLKEYTTPPTEEEFHLETSDAMIIRKMIRTAKSSKTRNSEQRFACYMKYLLSSKDDLIKKREYWKLKITFLSIFLFKSIFFNSKSAPCISTSGKIPRKFVFETPPWAMVGSFWNFQFKYFSY